MNTLHIWIWALFSLLIAAVMGMFLKYMGVSPAGASIVAVGAYFVCFFWRITT